MKTRKPTARISREDIDWMLSQGFVNRVPNMLLWELDVPIYGCRFTIGYARGGLIGYVNGRVTKTFLGSPKEIVQQMRELSGGKDEHIRDDRVP